MAARGKLCVIERAIVPRDFEVLLERASESLRLGRPVLLEKAVGRRRTYTSPPTPEMAPGPGLEPG